MWWAQRQKGDGGIPAQEVSGLYGAGTIRAAWTPSPSRPQRKKKTNTMSPQVMKAFHRTRSPSIIVCNRSTSRKPLPNQESQHVPCLSAEAAAATTLRREFLATSALETAPVRRASRQAPMTVAQQRWVVMKRNKINGLSEARTPPASDMTRKARKEIPCQIPPRLSRCATFAATLTCGCQLSLETGSLISSALRQQHLRNQDQLCVKFCLP